MATLKLDLGSGNRPTPGFKAVDITGEPDYLVDLFQYPWPFKDRSVREVVSNHLIEHIPHYRPEYNGVDGFWMFFNELHRICTKNAKVTLHLPVREGRPGVLGPVAHAVHPRGQLLLPLARHGSRRKGCSTIRSRREFRGRDDRRGRGAGLDHEPERGDAGAKHGRSTGTRSRTWWCILKAIK